MRTTLTLDEDVATKLKHRSRQSGESFKEVVNRELRNALNMKQVSKRVRPFHVKARRLQLRAGISLDNIAELLEQIDGPAHK